MTRRAKVILIVVGILLAVAVAFADEVPSADETPPDGPLYVCLDFTHVVVEYLQEPLPTDEDILRDHIWENFIWTELAQSKALMSTTGPGWPR